MDSIFLKELEDYLKKKNYIAVSTNDVDIKRYSNETTQVKIDKKHGHAVYLDNKGVPFASTNIDQIKEKEYKNYV